MNLPNQLTLLRIVFSFLLILFLLMPGFLPKCAALGVFLAACLTDLWDGRLARRWGQVTDFGVLMDPIADKILVLAAFVAFVQLNIAPAWMVVLIASREFLVTGLRLFALGKGHVLPAEAAGKHKTVSQMVTISITLIGLLAMEWDQMLPGPHVNVTGMIVIWVVWWLMLLTVILTMTSGISFFWRHRKLILNL